MNHINSKSCLQQRTFFISSIMVSAAVPGSFLDKNERLGLLKWQITIVSRHDLISHRNINRMLHTIIPFVINFTFWNHDTVSVIIFIYLFIKYSKIDSRYYIQFLSYLIQSIEGIKRVFFFPFISSFSC